MRIERNLRVRATEHPQDAGLYKRFIGEKALPEVLSAYKNKQIGYSEIVRDGADDTDEMGSQAEWVWRFLSGLTHPYAGRFNLHSIHVPMGAHADGGDVSARLPSARMVAAALSTVLVLNKTMLDMVTRRSIAE